MGRGFGVAAAVDNEAIKQVAKTAEETGYTSFWVNDTPAADGLDALAAAASVTTDLKLGVGVISLDRRPADTVAEDVKRYGLPQGRLWLGLGSADPKGALGKVRSSVELLKRELECEVIIAALGPKMTALAGEVADGVLFNWLTPAFAAQSADRVQNAAQEAGRDVPRIMAYVRAGLLPDAEERIMSEANRYAGITAYANHFERQGIEAHLTVLRGVNPPVLQAGIKEFEAVLDETVVRAITKDDEAETILELLHACAPRAAS
ncbi:MAG: LLM class flavin-dependent oxidoreductase [Chloroflexota bacterium]